MKPGFEEDVGDCAARVIKYCHLESGEEIVLRRYLSVPADGSDDDEGEHKLVLHRTFRMNKNNVAKALEDVEHLEGLCDDIAEGVFSEYTCPLGGNKYIHSEAGTGIINFRTYLGGMSRMITTIHGVPLHGAEVMRVLFLMRKSHPLMNEPSPAAKRLNPVERKRLAEERQKSAKLAKMVRR